MINTNYFTQFSSYNYPQSSFKENIPQNLSVNNQDNFANQKDIVNADGSVEEISTQSSPPSKENQSSLFSSFINQSVSSNLKLTADQLNKLIPCPDQKITEEQMSSIINNIQAKRKGYKRKNPSLKHNPRILPMTVVDPEFVLLHFNKRKKIGQFKTPFIGKGTYKKCCKGLMLKKGQIEEIADITYKKNTPNVEDWRKEVTKEISLMQLFESPHIIKEPYYSAEYKGKNRQIKYRFAMELMQGDLYALKKQLTFDDKIKVFKGALKGLIEIHSKGYVHRDTKPMNIFVNKDGRGVIGDLGLTTKLEISVVGHGRTTPGYYPPERDSPQDYTWDCYAIGVSIAEVFFGGITLEKAKLNYNKIIQESIEKDLIEFTFLTSNYQCINDLVDKLTAPKEYMVESEIVKRMTAEEALNYLDLYFPLIEA